MKKAFTLAEILVTLGIIGIIAALTLPALIASYRKNVIETRLEKFYSVIQQASKLSEVDNGEFVNWTYMPADMSITDWYDKYFAPYLKTVKKEVRKCPYTGNGGVNSMLVYFPDGSAADICANSRQIFYPDAKNAEGFNNYYGKKGFYFVDFQVFNHNWDGNDINVLYTGGNEQSYACDGVRYGYYCGKIIQVNGWKIPDDYPFSF